MQFDISAKVCRGGVSGSDNPSTVLERFVCYISLLMYMGDLMNERSLLIFGSEILEAKILPDVWVLRREWDDGGLKLQMGRRW